LRRLGGGLVLFLALATPAYSWAQEGDPPAAPAAIAQELIAQASAEDLFELVAAEHLVAVRHSRSGLVCRMDPDSRNRIVIFAQAARGEDVACDSTDGRESVTLYATRFSFETDLDEQIAGAENAVRHRFPNAEPYSATIEESADSAAPASRSMQFIVARQDGARMYTRASVALVDGWAIKLRYTVVAPDDETARQGELTSALLWRSVLAEIAASPAS